MKLCLENVLDKQKGVVIEAVVTPQVCTAVMKVPGDHIQNEMERRGLPLGDFPADETAELAVLIGSDYY